MSKQWDPDQTMHAVAADLGLHCLLMSHKKDVRLIWVMSAYQKINFLISQPKHMLKRMDKKIFRILSSTYMFI